MLLQIIDSVVTDSATVAVPLKTDYIELAQKGGGMMIVIGLMFFVALYLFLERLFTIRRVGANKHFIANIKDMVANGNIAGAKNLCLRTATPIARVLEKGLTRLGQPITVIEAGIDNARNLEAHKLKRGLPMLAILAGILPMLGILATANNMLNAFNTVAQAGNSAGVNTLAAALYGTLPPAIAGLAVGIFAFVAYNLLIATLGRALYRLEAVAIEFIDHLQEPS